MGKQVSRIQIFVEINPNSLHFNIDVSMIWGFLIQFDTVCLYYSLFVSSKRLSYCMF